MDKSNKNMNESQGRVFNTTLNELIRTAESSNRMLLPLEMIWQPKEDITPYELAMCLPYLFRHRGVMPYEVDKSLPYFRHFKIIDHNS